MTEEPDNGQVTELFLDVPEGQHTDIRLDKYITSFIQNATRTKVQQAIKDGHVVVNGKREKASYIMQPGDKIEITLPKPPPPELVAEEMELDIVYEDPHLLVVNKPKGMVVHPAYGNWSGTLVNGLLYHTSRLTDIGKASMRPGIVHRLDKDTSGLLVVAKTDEAHHDLAIQFAEKSVDRTYVALVWGYPPETGTVESMVGRSVSDRKRMTVLNDGRGKHAVTHFRRIEQFDHLALLEIRLETGRTHQIRVHMEHEGYYVFGDTTYGGDTVRYGPNTGTRKAMFRNLFSIMPSQMLHAKTLGFRHPATGESVLFDSDLPEAFDLVLQKIRHQCARSE